MREKIAKGIPSDCDACDMPACGQEIDSVDYPCPQQLLMADNVLTLITQEIKAVGNDYSESWDYTQWLAWQNCHNKILALFKEN